MRQEEKNLLLKDLCTRLPYQVKVKLHDEICTVLGYVDDFIILTSDTPIGQQTNIVNVKPYLRPMESMTEEEGKELERLFCEIDAPCWVDTTYGCVTFAGDNDFIDAEIAEVYTDWLNAHHFDYRGLIPIGLALEAPKDMYNVK